MVGNEAETSAVQSRFAALVRQWALSAGDVAALLQDEVAVFDEGGVRAPAKASVEHRMRLLLDIRYELSALGTGAGDNGEWLHAEMSPGVDENGRPLPGTALAFMSGPLSHLRTIRDALRERQSGPAPSPPSAAA